MMTVLFRWRVTWRARSTRNNGQACSTTKGYHMVANQVSAELAAADVEAIAASIAAIKAKLPFLIDLSPAERKTLPKMGDKSQAFVRAALEEVFTEKNGKAYVQ